MKYLLCCLSPFPGRELWSPRTHKCFSISTKKPHEGAFGELKCFPCIIVNKGGNQTWSLWNIWNSEKSRCYYSFLHLHWDAEIAIPTEDRGLFFFFFLKKPISVWNRQFLTLAKVCCDWYTWKGAQINGFTFQLNGIMGHSVEVIPGWVWQQHQFSQIISSLGCQWQGVVISAIFWLGK